MARKPTPQPKGGSKPPSPWLPPSTPNTWMCRNGHINLYPSTNCGSCR